MSSPPMGGKWRPGGQGQSALSRLFSPKDVSDPTYDGGNPETDQPPDGEQPVGLTTMEVTTAEQAIIARIRLLPNGKVTVTKQDGGLHPVIKIEETIRVT